MIFLFLVRKFIFKIGQSIKYIWIDCSVPLHNWIDHKMCRMVNDHWVAAIQSTGLNVVEYGDDISKVQIIFTLHIFQ